MYFPIFELRGWGKRFADQPQSICSEIPKGRKTGRSVRNAPQRVKKVLVIPRGRSDRGNPFPKNVRIYENSVENVTFWRTDCHTSLRTGSQ